MCGGLGRCGGKVADIPASTEFKSWPSHSEFCVAAYLPCNTVLQKIM